MPKATIYIRKENIPHWESMKTHGEKSAWVNKKLKEEREKALEKLLSPKH